MKMIFQKTNLPRRVRFLFILGLATLSPAAAINAGVTTLHLSGANEPNSNVILPVGDTAKLIAPTETLPGARWYKDGVAIGEIDKNVLILVSLKESDSGLYSFVAHPWTVVFGNKIQLTVKNFAVGQFCNFSSRITLRPGNGRQIVGFVVEAGHQSILIRAVGDSLRKFGITNPVASPRIEIYDAKGQLVDFVRPAVVFPPDYWPRVFANAGAFPLTGNEVPYVAFTLGGFREGAYTVHVSDDSQMGGEVLVEVYKVSVDTPILALP